MMKIVKSNADGSAKVRRTDGQIIWLSAAQVRRWITKPR
jgi:hypothetical protein